MYDWIILLLLAVIDGLLNLIEPFHRFVGRDMMTDLRYPMKGNTVPFWAVPVCSGVLIFDYWFHYFCAIQAVLVRLVTDFSFLFLQLIGIVLPGVIFGGIYFKKKNFYDLHHGILGILHAWF
jgi:diacylglycerol diphosphate phosphatase / phosphatidate phosphatase